MSVALQDDFSTRDNEPQRNSSQYLHKTYRSQGFCLVENLLLISASRLSSPGKPSVARLVILLSPDPVILLIMGQGLRSPQSLHKVETGYHPKASGGLTTQLRA
ncbi:hypothetical protein RRG08_027671 [Elysia crispata]|uniref:Uncharacterized protein n=1 Tax=Elysia crispata TaxID=231223 RepID=A0AAE0XMF4_9GAST|nr:hypothetical protein RRG08_027671 [Elysia crispata]